MVHTCQNCKKETSLPVETTWEGFACGYCKTLFNKNPNTGLLEQKQIFNGQRYDTTLEIGMQCRLDFDDWTVMGYTEQDIVDADDDGWCEYFLVNEYGEMRYLSVYDGYWMLAKEEEYEASRFDNTNTVYMPEGEYSLYSEERFKTVFAEGFFRENIPLGPRLSKDYILPPETILVETDSSGTHAFKGRRLSRQEMQQAFPEAKLPSQEGTDILNPRFYSMTETLSILACTGLVLLVFLIWSYKSSKFVAEGFVTMESNKDSTVVTAPFDLSHARQMLCVETKAEVQNSWVYAGVNLINVETGEEQFAENEISYYSGVEGGESWSEGSRSNEVKFCNVKAGKYVLAFNLFKPADNNTLGTFAYKVEDGGVPIAAFFIALLVLVIFAFVAYYLEKRRWEYSEFTPYPVSEEEE